MRIIRYLSEDLKPILAALTSEGIVYPSSRKGLCN